MKIIFAVIITFLLSSYLPAQQPTFTLPTEIGQGFRFKDYQNPQSSKPTYTTADGKLSVSAIGMTNFSDGITDYFAGNGVTYRVLSNKNFSLSAGATALFGTHERKLFGGNVMVDQDLFYIIINARQEYTQKEFWFDGAVGIKLFK